MLKYLTGTVKKNNYTNFFYNLLSFKNSDNFTANPNSN